MAADDFPGLKKASLGASRGGRNNSVSYNTWVECDRGYVALLSVSGGSEDSHRALVQEINAAVDDPAVLALSDVYGPHPLFRLALSIFVAVWSVAAVRCCRECGGRFERDRRAA